MTQSNKSEFAAVIAQMDPRPHAETAGSNDHRASRKHAIPKTDKKLTKAQAVLKLLHRKKGASIEELMKATGWQAHSVRGFLSGTVRKRMGLAVDIDTTKSGIRRYRILDPVSDKTVAGASS